MQRGRIAAVMAERPAPATGHVQLESGVLTAGLVDLHNNGAFGVDFAAAPPDRWSPALRALARRGVTAVQPTLITGPLDDLHAGCERYEHALARSVPDGARLVGVHLEGPFISPQRKGAHRAEWILDPTPAAIDRLLEHGATRRVLKTLTIAPERPHALAAIRRLREQGVVIAIGHTDATPELVRAAVDAGATTVTHLFNAQRPLHHRDPGVTGAALTDPRLSLGLIVDGQHVHPDVCRLAFAAAPGRIIAVTDSILTAGLPPNTALRFGGLPVANDDTGLGRRPDGTIAGAGIVLDDGVRRMIAAGVDAGSVLAAATEAPARALGRTDIGHLRAGAHADLVWWDEDFNARRVWMSGREIGGVGRGPG